ncbi:hypothetical protein TWF694_002207 [Orbilia ellipsospora]|uniref:Protein kinase domain-containing protein n=1 Tax=Orbilia ellipsospora TaxID=2528407 RepID=A0AAV9X2I4_9PEZI
MENCTLSQHGYDKCRITVGPWRLGRNLGEGAFGRVFLGKHQMTGKFAAIKTIKKEHYRETTTSIQEAGWNIQHAIEREIIIMKLLAHPNATRLYEIWDNTDEIYLVIEYVSGGDLLQYMTKNETLPEKEVANLFRQFMEGLSHLHRISVYHRDLKHENIMVDHRGNLKIGDFGMAALQPYGKQFVSACGSPNYAAPEVIRNLPYNGSDADIWSAGIILYGLLTHQLPFDDPDTSVILSRIVRAEYHIPQFLSSEAAELIDSMLEVDPTKRIKLDQILVHPFILKHWEPDLLKLQIPEYPPHEGMIACLFGNESIIHQLDMNIISKVRALWMNQSEEILSEIILSGRDYSALRNMRLSLFEHKSNNDKPRQRIVRSIGWRDGTSDHETKFIRAQQCGARKKALTDLLTTDRYEDRRASPANHIPRKAWKTMRQRCVIFRNSSITSSQRENTRARDKSGKISETTFIKSTHQNLMLMKRQAVIHKLAENQQMMSQHSTLESVTRSRLSVFEDLGHKLGPSGEATGIHDIEQRFIAQTPVLRQGTEDEMNRRRRELQFQRAIASWRNMNLDGGVRNIIWEVEGAQVNAPIQFETPAGNKAFVIYRPVLQVRREIILGLNSWQSYGVGRVRMTRKMIIWSETAIIGGGSKTPLICTVGLVDLDGCTVAIMYRECGSLTRLGEVVVELLAYMSAHGFGLLKNKEEQEDEDCGRKIPRTDKITD